MKVLSIKEKAPRPASLPDGLYTGTWGGYFITLFYNKKTYELKTEDGVRGVGFKVVVTIKNGEATFEHLKN